MNGSMNGSINEHCLRSIKHLVGISALVMLPLLATHAQSDATAKTPAKAADEAIDTSGTVGTTIIGDQESPIGLYITPWKDEYAERGLDRPARLLDEAMEPIDPASFRRQIEYYETITRFRRNQQGGVPTAEPGKASP